MTTHVSTSASDGSRKEDGNVSSLHAATDVAVFKKRSRPSSSKLRKKRVRSTAPIVDDGAAERHLSSDSSLNKPSSSKNGTEPQNGNRIQERYSITENETNVLQNDATAQLLNVGGERPTSTASTQRRKPFGPMRAPAHLRASVRVDYQPDVCKDYKETGYCGFGDTCKFLHDRSDYKAGWQLDRDWATLQRERRQRMLRGEDPDAHPDAAKANDNVDDDGLPFACFICRGEFKQPVMTLCQHYFCEDCALQRIQNEGTCAICKKQMRGTLNAAPKLTAKLKLKRGNKDSIGGDGDEE